MALTRVDTPYKHAYREVFNLHRVAVDKLADTPVDTLWLWYWEQAQNILDAAGTAYDFTMDIIIAVALDVERQQVALIDAGRLIA